MQIDLLSAIRRIASRLVAPMLAVAIAAIPAGCGDDGEDDVHVPLGQGHDFGSNNPNLYVAMGDSITEGNKDPEIVPYPTRLSEMLGKPVVNLGEGGAWSGDGVDQVDEALYQFQPGFLLLLYGANDIHPDHNPAETVSNIAYMVDAARANKTIPVIATLTPFIEGKRGYLAQYVPPVSEAIRQYAARENVPLVDLEKAFGNNAAYLKPDGLHPSESGTQLIAEMFCDVLK
ncbi:MAG: SGNH/GDSL hydrolase family protein [bacterium]